MKILAACSPGEALVAVVADDGALQDVALWRPGRPDGVGDVYRARVSAHVQGLAGAFLTLPGADGFLPDSEGGAGAIEGALLTVRITRAGQGGKGPRLSAKLPQAEGAPGLVAPGLVAPGLVAPGLVARGPSPVERLAERFPDAAIVTDDPAVAAQLRPRLGDRVSFAGTVLDAGLADQIAALDETEIALPGGLRASIHPTPALVAIDVDMAAATGARQPKQAAQLAANLAAMPALARQIRLRNLSGAILIDPAGISVKRRLLLRPALEAALAADPMHPRLIGFTGLGLIEILRPRIHPPWHELRAGPHAAGLAALRTLARESAAAPHTIYALVAAPDLVAALAHDPIALADLARRTGRALIPKPDPALPPGAWRIERAS